jgi:hypothetical protein
MKNSISILALLIAGQSLIGQVINEIGYYSINGIIGITTRDNYMILSNGSIIDNAIPSSPTLVGQYSINGDGTSVLTEGDCAYFGTGMTSELFVVDISNVTFPLYKSSIDFSIGNGIFGMDINDNTLFIALGLNGTVCSIDVNDESNPLPLDTLSIPGGQCRDVVANNNYIYAAHYDGLKIIDVIDPSNMQLVTSIGSGYNSIALGDDLVFLGKSSSGGVDVFNISDPENPVPAFSLLDSGGTAWDLAYEDNHLYLATNGAGLVVYEIEPDSGNEVGNYPNTGNGQSFGVALQDSLILLSGLINGVAILQYDSIGVVGLPSLALSTQFSIYPNPAENIIHLSTDKHFIDKIEILNSQGVRIKELTNYRADNDIQIGELPAGQYAVRLEADNQVLTKTFIKRH